MKYPLLFLLSMACLQSCTAQNNGPKEPALPKEYEACCGVQPVDFKLGKHSIYVPNVFTPNNDGVNDYFYPFVSPEIGEVQGFTVFSAVGDTVLFQRPTLVYDKLESFAWNGLRNNGSAYRGRFKYGMRIVSKDGLLRFVEGEACSILCEPGTKELKVKKNCFYPSQAGKDNKAGMLDSTLDNKENDCLK
jgi:hypothetical protein